MDKIILEAEKRKVFGRKVKSLRAKGIIPANVYGKKIKSQAVAILLKDFQRVYEKAGETGLIELRLGKDSLHVLVGDVQTHPTSGEILHVDFRAVDLKEKITATVPVEVLGESPAEKEGRGTAVTMIDEVEVEALPSDLPEKFEVDASVLTEVDQAIYVKDLKVDRSKVEIKTDPQIIVVKVEPPQKEEEIAPSPATEEPVSAEETPAAEEAESGAKEAEEKASEEDGKPEEAQ